MKKRINTLLISAFSILSASFGLAACGINIDDSFSSPDSSTSSVSTTSTTSTSTPAGPITPPSDNIPASKQLNVCLASEPIYLDPQRSSGTDELSMLVHLNSGLYHYVKAASGDLELVYDLAQGITKTTTSVIDSVIDDDNPGLWKNIVYSDGVRYTVTLRDNIKWSDGTPITADDFIYSWNRVSGYESAGNFGYLFDFLAGYAHHSSDDSYPLAMTKIANNRFSFDLPKDIPYLDQLLAFPTFFPVQKTAIDNNGNTWSTNSNTYRSSGAYTLKSWNHNTSIVLVKNPNYWNADNIKMEKITFTLSNDSEAILARYKNGQYEMIDDVPIDQINSLRLNYSSEFYSPGLMGTYYLTFNVNSTVFNAIGNTEAKRAKIRRALALFIDRKYIIDEISRYSQTPANALISTGLTDPAGGEFVDHNGPDRDGSGYFRKGGNTAEYSANIAEAIQLLKEVGYTFNETTQKFVDFPTFRYLCNTSAGHIAIAENIRDTLAIYGIEITLENQEWASFLQTRKEGNYDVARNGWVADYDDPSSYLAKYATASNENCCQLGRGSHGDQSIYICSLGSGTWAETYDVLVEAASNEMNLAQRYELCHEAEDLLMSTGAICPIYCYSDIYMLKQNINGFFSTPFGIKHFMYCTKTSA